MSDDEGVAADLGELDGFVDGSTEAMPPLWELHAELSFARSALLALPLDRVVEYSWLDRFEELLGFMGENQRFVADISAAVKRHDNLVVAGLWDILDAVVAAELAQTDGERLTQLEQQLKAQGVDQAQAAELVGIVERLLAADRSLGFDDAVIGAMAEFQGVSRAEFEQAIRAFSLERGEAVGVVADSFSEVASRTGRDDQITIEDLQAIVDDPSVDEGLRDAAYRLAADAVLFVDVDVALQSDLSALPYGGFAWGDGDGVLGRDDFAVFGEKDLQHRVLSAWGPLIDTANQGYDLTEADSVVGEDDVAAFVEDSDIPVYVR